jgi:hypothetical protein
MNKYRLTALAIFLSAFLLFAIQPIASKHLLPYFGGSSSVWATSLLFFTTILFFGYAYVYFLTSQKARSQTRIHASVIGVIALITVALTFVSGSIYPSLDWLTESTLHPSLRVLLALTLGVGLPYFALSTTGPLLQYWYGSISNEQPYKLYALSNVGSLLALLSYPFLIEPFIPLPAEEIVWVALFALYAALVGIIALSMRHVHIERARFQITSSRSQTLEWIGYAALPAFLLVAVTTVITQLISPVPLLWILPLAIYLITFILAFSGAGRTVYMPLFVLIAAVGAYLYTPARPSEIVPHVSTYLTFLFFACMMCHVLLYEKRPDTAGLPSFYLATSLGGAIGTLLASIVAPLLLNDFWEFAIGLALAAATAFAILSNDFYPRIMKDRTIRAIKIIVPFLIGVLLVNTVTAAASPSVLVSRNFYGTVQLKFEEDATVLQHGTTVHGLQATEQALEYVPSTYYTRLSGVGRALQYTDERLRGLAKRVAIVGLGTGTLATYCNENDVFMFFEIDPRIKETASSYFSYLAKCEHSGVKIGDGRILLQQESDEALPGYDVIAVDAFTDDSIPAHLMTKEAVALYAERLRTKRGIIAIHTSNRYLALSPVILSIAEDLGLTILALRR